MAGKRRLQELDRDIKFWQNLVKDYPQAESYANTLAKIRQERTELANQIGSKRCRSNTKK
jgi:hypothetical protein